MKYMLRVLCAFAFMIVALAAIAFLPGDTVSSAAAAGAAPSITSLSASTLARSGRLLIQGTGFGATKGTSHVDIAGGPAWVTRWSDTLIAAYVPETAQLGATTVQVFVGANASNTVGLTVTTRTANGRVKWRFQADSMYFDQRPAVGADGTVVGHDSSGFIYALTPDGGLKWIYKTRVFAAGPPSIGGDGTVYVADSSTITAINPDGSLKWSFTEPQGGQGVMAGPTVGPDGNIYAVTDLGGLGALALSPAGQLLWSNQGNPVMAEIGQIGAEIVFGPSHSGGAVDQFYVAFDDYGTDARTHLYAFRLTGAQAWTVPLFMSKDTFMMYQQQPAVGPDGKVYLSAAIPTGGNWSLNAFDPATGALLGSFFPSPGTGMSEPTIGKDSTAYFGQSLSYLQAVNASGALKWQFFDGSILSYPVVSPANDIVFTGGAPNFGVPGFAKAFSTSNGQLLWSLDLGAENGGNQGMESIPRFTPDGSTVYFGTVIAGSSSSDTYCYLYALDTAARGSLPHLASLTLSPASVKGGTAAKGTITLTGAAPPGGAVVTLASNSTKAIVPASVKVPAGATSATFVVKTRLVKAARTVSISATYNGDTVSATLTILP